MTKIIKMTTVYENILYSSYVVDYYTYVRIYLYDLKFAARTKQIYKTRIYLFEMNSDVFLKS